MEDKLTSEECDGDFHERIMLSVFRGTTCAYALTPNEFHECDCTYVVMTNHSEYPKQVRAYREQIRISGKKAEPLPKHALGSELMVLPGPDMSPEQVVAALEQFIRLVRARYLVIGKGKENEYMKESISGEPRIDFC